MCSADAPQSLQKRDACVCCSFLFQSLINKPALSSRPELNTLPVTAKPRPNRKCCLPFLPELRSGLASVPASERQHRGADPGGRTESGCRFPPRSSPRRYLQHDHVTCDIPLRQEVNTYQSLISDYLASSLGRIQSVCSRRWFELSADVSRQQSAAAAGTARPSTSPAPAAIT